MSKDSSEKNIALFLRFLSFREKMPKNTINAYGNDIKKFVQFTNKKGIMELKDINEEIIDLYVKNLEKSMKPATIKRNISSLRKFFKYLKKKRVINKNDLVKPVQFVDISNNFPVVLTINEVKLIVKAVKSRGFLALRDKAIILFIYSTGAKVSQVCNAKVKDLDLLNAVFVHNSDMGKREIPFSKEVIPVLNRYLAERKKILERRSKLDSKYIFLNRSGDRLTRQGIYFIVRKYAKKAKIQKIVSPYTLRYSIISHLFFYGDVSLKELKEIFGYTATPPLILMHSILPKTRTNFVFLETHPVFRSA